MFCPVCKVEYDEGFSSCSKCEVGLVDKLPSYSECEHVDTVSVYCGDPNSADMVRAILEDIGINAWIKDEGLRNVYPNMRPVDIMVRTEDKMVALEALESVVQEEGVSGEEGFEEEVDGNSIGNVSHVAKPTSRSTLEYVGTVSVFYGDSNSADVVRSLLESAGIAAWIQDQLLRDVYMNFGPVDVMVRAEDQEAALEAIESAAQDGESSEEDEL